MTPNERLVQSHISSDRIWGLSIIPLLPPSPTSPTPRLRVSRPYDLRHRKRRRDIRLGKHKPSGTRSSARSVLLIQILGVSPPSTSADRSPSVRAAIGSVSSSVRFSHGLSGRRTALDRRKARGAGTEGSSRLTVDIKQSVYLVHSRRTDAFLTPWMDSVARDVETAAHRLLILQPDGAVQDAERFHEAGLPDASVKSQYPNRRGGFDMVNTKHGRFTSAFWRSLGVFLLSVPMGANAVEISNGVPESHGRPLPSGCHDWRGDPRGIRHRRAPRFQRHHRRYGCRV